jgi:hypothetical protein
MSFRELLEPYSEEPISRQILMSLLKDYKRPYDKVNELVKQKYLVPVKNAFYVPGPASGLAMPESFLIANHLWGPSYVSLESALSYWGIIPERVFEIISITTKRANAYKTAVGRFTYLHASLPYYSFGIKSVQLTRKQCALVATPEKALCDKIIMTSGIILRSTAQTKEFLLEDLRAEEEMLKKLNLKQISSWINNAPKKTSIEMLAKTLETI